jgi:hypothetical protein
MDIKELLQVTETIFEVANKHNYWQTITQLRTSINQLKNAQRAQQPQLQTQQITTFKSNIETQRTQALNVLFEIQSSIINLKEIKSYNKSNLDSTFGQGAINLLERIPRELDSNLDALFTDITQYTQRVTQSQHFLASINFVLGDINTDEEENNIDKFILFFEEGATIESLKELAKASEDWNQIVNCFSRLVKDNNTDTKVISAERGSLVLTLTFSTGIILGLVRASDKVLDVILKGYEIKKKALELKQMKLAAIDDAIKILEKQAKLNVTSEANTITQELLGEYNWDPQDELYNETKAAVSQAVSRIIRFQNAGGKIDSKLHQQTEEQKVQTESLKTKNIKFLKVEDEVKRLSGGNEILQLEDGMKGEDEPNDSGADENAA